jgi:predicted nucleic acid-binding protein
MFLLDTNVVILAANPAEPKLTEWLLTNEDFAISVVTRIEALGYHRLTADERAEIEGFLRETSEFELTDDIASRAVALRQQRKMGLGDAIIAATALVHGMTLATRNVADFRWIAGLTIVDPLAVPGS